MPHLFARIPPRLNDNNFKLSEFPSITSRPLSSRIPPRLNVKSFKLSDFPRITSRHLFSRMPSRLNGKSFKLSDFPKITIGQLFARITPASFLLDNNWIIISLGFQSGWNRHKSCLTDIVPDRPWLLRKKSSDYHQMRMADWSQTIARRPPRLNGNSFKRSDFPRITSRQLSARIPPRLNVKSFKLSDFPRIKIRYLFSRMSPRLNGKSFKLSDFPKITIGQLFARIPSATFLLDNDWIIISLGFQSGWNPENNNRTVICTNNTGKLFVG